MATSFTPLFEKNLHKLAEEISLYKDESELWQVKEGISNSGGNLALHLVGNLNHFIGATLGNTGYVRDRDKEFSLKDIPRSKLIEDINNTTAVVTRVLNSLSEEDLDKDFPVAINNTVSDTRFTLMFFLVHLSYHLGQINYLRRLIG